MKKQEDKNSNDAEDFKPLRDVNHQWKYDKLSNVEWPTQTSDVSKGKNEK